MSSDFMPTGSNPSSSAFTCNSCGIKFVAAEFQRQHMKTDWHRYNLKRKVAQLPPISSDVFAHKILQQKKLAELEGEVDEFGFAIKPTKVKNDKKKKGPAIRGRLSVFDRVADESSREASPASMSDFSEFSLGESDAYESNYDTGSEINFSERSDHESDLAFTTEEEDNTDAAESDLESIDEYVNIMPITQCFYCGDKHTQVDENVEHMLNTHGLYIPERAHLSDLDGLLTFISEVVTLDHECLVCGFQGRSIESVRQHMDSKGHCRIPYETAEERDVVAEFYNFSDKLRMTEEGDQVLVNPGRLDALQGNLASMMRLPSGTTVQHRTSARTRHRQLVLVKRQESSRTVALADRRLAPGLNYHTLTRFEKSTRRNEVNNHNYDERRTKSYRVNFKRSYRDQVTGSITAL